MTYDGGHWGLFCASSWKLAFQFWKKTSDYPLPGFRLRYKSGYNPHCWQLSSRQCWCRMMWLAEDASRDPLTQLLRHSSAAASTLICITTFYYLLRENSIFLHRAVSQTTTSGQLPRLLVDRPATNCVCYCVERHRKSLQTRMRTKSFPERDGEARRP